MYLNIGKGAVIPTDGIVAILDLDITSQSHLTRRYLQLAEKSGQVVNASEDIPKSFLLCDHPFYRQIVYLSQFNSRTLQRRMEEGEISYE